MTSDTRDQRPIASVDDAEAFVAMICFKHGPPRRIGVELEWTVHHRGQADRPLEPQTLMSALGAHAPTTISPDSPHRPLDHGSLVTVEPGGQVELSTTPSTDVQSLVLDTTADIAALDALLDTRALVRGEHGTDPDRSPTRILDVPRYAAMQRFFDRIGHWGSTMMCSTASTQVCVDVGERHQLGRRWRALHAIGPAMVALFANSAISAGRRTGWASHRLRATLGVCPPTTLPAAHDTDPVAAWVDRAMSAPVICVRNGGDCWDSPRPMRFADWVSGRVAGVAPPTYDDLSYHLSTLFPPVRPRGYLEVRYLDAQPSERWHHPVVMMSALLKSDASVDRALDAAEPGAGRWLQAARDGLRDDRVRDAAADLVAVAADHLDALNLSPALAEPVLETLERRTSPSARRLPV